MVKGKIKWWSKENSYGFIEIDEKNNYFVHIDKVNYEPYIIEENTELEFELEEKETGTFLNIFKIIKN